MFKKLLLLVVLLLPALTAQTGGTRLSYVARITEVTVATLPASGNWAGRVFIVTDGSAAGDCTTGSGSTRVLCHWTGAAWAALGDGSGSGADALGTGDPGTNGIVVRTAEDVTTARTLTGDAEIVVVDGNGVLGNPTLAIAAAIARDAEVAAAYQPLDTNLTNLAAATSTGMLVQTGAATYTVRAVTGDSEITVTNGDGVAGAPTLAIAAGLTRDTEWDTAAEINAATTDTDFLLLSSQNAGTDYTADLEEETHAAEHAENAADELLVENLGTACPENEIPKANATGGIVCATDATGGGSADMLGSFASPTERTLASGTATFTAIAQTIDTEADAATDDWTGATCAAGVSFSVRPANDARSIVIVNASIPTPANADLTMDQDGDMALAYCESANTPVVLYFRDESGAVVTSGVTGGSGGPSRIDFVEDGTAIADPVTSGRVRFGIESTGKLIQTRAAGGSAKTYVTTADTQTLTNKTLTTPVIASISNGGTITIPSGADTLVTLTASQTLTNKTLTAPVISTISNTGTVTLPTATDTLVARATTDTLTNKTVDGDSNEIMMRTAADCTALTDGVIGEVCADTDDGALFVCIPSAGACDTAGEWKAQGGGGCTIDEWFAASSTNNSTRYPANGQVYGANITAAEASFTLDDNETFTQYWMIPRCWTSEQLDFTFWTRWNGTADTGTSNMEITFGCASVPEANYTDNSLQTISNIETPSASAQYQTYTLTNLTTTGCVAGDLARLVVTFDLNGRTGNTSQNIQGYRIYTP